MLDKLITRDNLKKLAGAACFQRGEDYFKAGAVLELSVDGSSIIASVAGSDVYDVVLEDAGTRLRHDCSCPHAADGFFCKHCVAAGLAWLKDGTARRSGRAKPSDPLQKIRRYLEAQPAQALAELLLACAKRDKTLRQDLLLRAETRGGDAAAAYRRRMDAALAAGGWNDWRAAPALAAEFDHIIDLLDGLLKPATASILADLAEYGIVRLEQETEQVDDSNGELGDVLTRLGELHLQACTLAKEDPVQLAERLFALGLDLPIGVWSFDPLAYRKALGKKGMARYQELVTAEWKALTPPKNEFSFNSRWFRISSLMESLARESGNLERLIAIKSRDLSSSFRYLEIAELCAEAKQHDAALAWAERGMQAFPKHTDSRLVEFLINAYLKRKRGKEALQLAWQRFETYPALFAYQELNRVAIKVGEWKETRKRALALIDSLIARQPKTRRPNLSLKLEIALWEKDDAAALEATQQGDCHRNLLLELAKNLETPRPADAIDLYCRIVPEIVAETNNSAYAEAVKLLQRLRKVMAAQGRTEEFEGYVLSLRIEFKLKRNFIGMLDAMEAKVKPAARKAGAGQAGAPRH